MRHQFVVSLVVCAALAGCAHGRCQAIGALLGCDCVSRARSEAEEPSITVPTFTSGEKIDSAVDGFTLRAIRIAANDYLPPETPPTTPCWSTQEAQVYRAMRRG